jgi:hypothetical protein
MEFMELFGSNSMERLPYSADGLSETHLVTTSLKVCLRKASKFSVGFTDRYPMLSARVKV